MKKITTQINRVILLTILVLVGIFYVSFYQLQKKIINEQIEQNKFLLLTIASGERRSFIDEIFDKRIDALKLHADNLSKISGITKVDAFSQHQISLLNKSAQNSIPQDADFDENAAFFKFDDHQMTMFYRLTAAGDIVGYLQFDFSLDKITATKASLSMFFWVFLTVLIISLLIVLYMSMYRVVINPIKQLTKMIQLIFSKNDYSSVDFSALPSKDLEINSYLSENPQMNELEILNTSFLHLVRKQKDFMDNLQEMVDEKSNKLISAIKDLDDLKEMLPICSSCKKIRDDQGYWHQVETYITKHSGIDFSHSVCPDCVKKLYPDFAAKKENGQRINNSQER